MLFVIYHNYVQALVYLQIMKLYRPANLQTSFTRNDSNSVSEWALMDDTRLSEDIGSSWCERFTDSSHVM